MSPRTHILAVASLALFSASAHAQLQAGWQKSIASSTPRDLRLDSGGDAWSFELSYSGVSNPNPVIRRYSTVGNQVWAAPLATLPVYSDNYTAFSIDPAGQFATFAYRSPQGSGITRIDGAGNFAWTNTNWGLNNIAYNYFPSELPVDAAGNSFVLCTTSGGPTSVDFVVVSFAADGSFRWSQRIDGGSNLIDVPTDITLDGAGGVYAVGVWNAPTLSNLLAGQMAITRVDAAGNVMWSRSFAGAGGGGQAFCVTTDASGNALVGGTSTTGTEAWLLKYDPTGTLLWSRSHSIGIGERYNDVVTDAAGAVYAAGEQHLGSAPQGDLLTDKRDANGTLLWRHVWPSVGAADEYVRRLHIDAAGRATVVAQRAAASFTTVVLRYERDGTPRTRADLVLQQDAIVTGSGADASGRVVLDMFSSQGPQWLNNTWTLELRDQSAPFCIGDGSSGACPCGNVSDLGSASGCRNSSGVGARLEDRGLASISNDAVSLQLQGATPTGTCLFVQGATQISPILFGDGQLCVSGQILRLYVKVASGGASQAPALGDGSVTQRAAAEGGALAAGDTRAYQVFYRDSDPVFCAGPSGSVFNMSSGTKITWAP